MIPSITSVKDRRKNLGITQKELANEAKLSQSLIAKLESGKIDPSYSTVSKLLEVLEKKEHKKEKSCKEIMTKNLIRLTPEEKVSRTIEIIKEKGISQIPIFKKEEAVGTITENELYDLLTKGVSKEELLNKKISEVMRGPLPILDEETPVSIVIPLLKYHKAILLRKNQKVTGILTKSDLLS
jgi:predicted transcriptional regulator